MNKQLWYANSTGGVPYTYGEVLGGTRDTCIKCVGMKRVDRFFLYSRGKDKPVHVGRKDGAHICPECKGQGFNRRLIND